MLSYWFRRLQSALNQKPSRKWRKTSQGRRQTLKLTLERLEDRTVPATFTVVNNLPFGLGSLRQAIFDANGTPNVEGPDRIEFNVGGEYQNPDGSVTIQPSSEQSGQLRLPSLTDAVVIDGYTQSGASANTLLEGSNAVLKVEVNLTSQGSLSIYASECTIRGLVLNRSPGAGIYIGSGSGNLIEGNFIGTDITGTQQLANGIGVAIGSYKTPSVIGHTIGGATLQARNIISGNKTAVDMNSINASANTIAGNWIGIGATSLPLLNGDEIIRVHNPAFTYDGAPKPAQIEPNAFVNSTPNGTSVVTYNGLTTVPTEVGFYEVTATFTSDEPNRVIAIGHGSVRIDPALPQVQVKPLVAGRTFTYDGNAHPATAQAVSLDESEPNGSFTYTYNGSTAAPVDPGYYDVVATFTDSNPNFLSVSATGRLVIRRATPTPTTVSVTLNGDDINQPGTLRYAIAHSFDGDTIEIDSEAINGPIILDSELLLDKDLNIQSIGSAPATISGGSTPNFNAGSRIFKVPSGADIHLVNLNLVNGFTSEGFGGGILNRGTLTLEDCTVSDNTAVGGAASLIAFDTFAATLASGGGIANFGNLTLKNTIVANNAAGVGVLFGGLQGQLMAAYSALGNPWTFDDAYSLGNGGGFFNAGILRVDANSTVSDNEAQSFDAYFPGAGGAGPDILGPIAPPVAAYISAPVAGPTPNRVTLTIAASDLSETMQQAGFSYTIDWGDGSDLESIGQLPDNGDPFNRTHDYASDGVYLVVVTAQNDDNIVSLETTALIALSTAVNDAITIPAAPGVYVGSTSGLNYSGAAPTDLIIVWGQGGGDSFTVNFGAGVTAPVILIGGGEGSEDLLTVNGDDSEFNYIFKSDELITFGEPATESIHYFGIDNQELNPHGTKQNYIEDPGGGTVINGGPGDNIIIITATAGTGVTINAGPASNFYILELGSLSGPVTINNSNPLSQDTVLVNGASGDNAIDITGNQITSGTQTISIDVAAPLTTLALNVGNSGGNNHVNLQNLTIPVQGLFVSATATDTIAVASDVTAPLAVNRSPSADAGGPYSISYGDLLDLDASASVDADLDTLTFSWTVNGNASAATGVSPTLTWAQLELLGVSAGNSFNVFVRVDDAQGHSILSTAAVLTITSGNHQPAITSITAQECTETELTFSVTASDPDVGDVLTYGLIGAPAGATIDSDGVFHWTPGENQLGQYTFIVRATDEGNLYDEQSVTVTTLGVVDGVLTIVGTGGRDVIRISPTGGDPDVVTVRIREVDYGFRLRPRDNPGHPYTDVMSIHVCGLGGDDEIIVSTHLQVDAELNGGAGCDTLKGGDGNDHIFGRSGNDEIRGDEGDDVIDAGSGCNEVRSGEGNDTVTAGNGDDRIWTDGGDDYINAGDGCNEVRSGDGNDTIITGSGNDWVWADGGCDVIDVGAGCDNVNAGAGNDVVHGGADNDAILGGAGEDILLGGDGNDLVKGNEGRDILIGGCGADLLIGNADEDLLIAGYTSYDANTAALMAILAEWNSSASYATRVANIQNGTGLTGGNRLNGNDGILQTVYNDNDIDTLTGNQGVDWFFANQVADNGGVLDILTDKAANETWSDTDF